MENNRKFLVFRDIYISPKKGSGTFCYNDNRIVFKGEITISYVNSSKYGEELKIGVLNLKERDYYFENRFLERYSRVEMYFPIDQLEPIIKALKELKERLDNKNIDKFI